MINVGACAYFYRLKPKEKSMHHTLENWVITQYSSVLEFSENGINLSKKREIFRCPSGWFLIVNTVLELMINPPSKVMVTKIEEVKGSLLITYTASSNEDSDYVFGLCDMAKLISKTACEICGQQGQMLQNDNLAARCSVHNELSFNYEETDSFKNPPFDVNKLGKRWGQMISTLYERVLALTNDGSMPDVKFNRVIKENGKLCIDYCGGNEVTHGMVDLLLLYSLKIDADTGQVRRRDNYEDLLNL